MGVFKCRHLLGAVKDYLSLSGEKPALPEDNLRDMMMVEEAKLEWQIARRYFNEVSEPALIDFAIYNMEAAEKRLVHLIKIMGQKYPDGIWPPEMFGPLKETVNEETEKTSLTEG